MCVRGNCKVYQLGYWYKTTPETRTASAINTLLPIIILYAPVPNCYSVLVQITLMFLSHVHIMYMYVCQCITIGCDCRVCIDTGAEKETVGGQLCEHTWAYMHVTFAHIVIGHDHDTKQFVKHSHILRFYALPSHLDTLQIQSLWSRLIALKRTPYMFICVQ